MALSGSLSTNTYNYSGSATISFKFSWTATQSITNNQSYVSWTLSASKSASGWVNGELELYASSGSTTLIDYVAPKATGDSRPRISDGTQTTGSFTLGHNDSGDGNFWVRIRARVYVGTAHDWTNTASTTFYLNQIQRATDISAIPSFNLEDSLSCTFTPALNTFTHTLVVSISNETIVTVNPYTSGTAVALTNAQILHAYEAMGTAKSADFTFSLTTYNGGTSLGTKTKVGTGTCAGTSKIRVSGSYKRALPWVRVNGVWKKALGFSRHSTWKRGI